MEKLLIIYHREDNDGVCSAAIVASFYDQFTDKNYMADFIGANYAELSQSWSSEETLQRLVNQYDKIFMVDISYNDPEIMEYLYTNKPEGFIWCDHHAPIIEASKNYTFYKTKGIRRTDQSALMNTWEFMNSMFKCNIKPSDALIELSDYDSWSWSRKEQYSDPRVQQMLFELNTGFTRRSQLRVSWFETYIKLILDGEGEEYCDIEDDCQSYGEPHITIKLVLKKIAGDIWRWNVTINRKGGMASMIRES